MNNNIDDDIIQIYEYSKQYKDYIKNTEIDIDDIDIIKKGVDFVYKRKEANKLVRKLQYYKVMCKNQNYQKLMNGEDINLDKLEIELKADIQKSLQSRGVKIKKN